MIFDIIASIQQSFGVYKVLTVFSFNLIDFPQIGNFGYI